MVGSVRLPGEGVAIAYWLRYYPEVVLFLPVALALGLRQGGRKTPCGRVGEDRRRAAGVRFARLRAGGFARHLGAEAREPVGRRAGEGMG